MKISANYLKIVEWSNEDQCFIGQCPSIIGPCCHGDDEVKVYNELCQIVDEWIEIMIADGKSLPTPTVGANISEKLLAKAAWLVEYPERSQDHDRRNHNHSGNGLLRRPCVL